MSEFLKYLSKHKVLIGMIHVPALPGSPSNKLSPKEIIELAASEALLYKKEGVSSIMIENMHDVPYLKGAVGHEISTLMAVIGFEIKKRTGLYCGIQILAAANKEALAAAHTAGLDFIRAEGFVYGHLADEGLIESSAAELMRYRRMIGAQDIAVFTDLKKKHSSHAISSDTSISEHASAANFFLSDGLVITGTSTGHEADIVELEAVKETVKIPVLIGSGITPTNISNYYQYADGFIVGSYLKKDGKWENPPDEERIRNMLHALKNCS